MQIHAEDLAKEIQDSITSVNSTSACVDERFAIYAKPFLQVQIVVTSDPDAYLDYIFPGLVTEDGEND